MSSTFVDHQVRGNVGHSGSLNHCLTGRTVDGTGKLETVCGRVVDNDTGYIWESERGHNCATCKDITRKSFHKLYGFWPWETN